MRQAIDKNGILLKKGDSIKAFGEKVGKVYKFESDGHEIIIYARDTICDGSYYSCEIEKYGR